MINVDNLAPNAPAPLADRSHLQARRQAWMLELERAMLSLTATRPGDPENASAQPSLADDGGSGDLPAKAAGGLPGDTAAMPAAASNAAPGQETASRFAHAAQAGTDGKGASQARPQVKAASADGASTGASIGTPLFTGLMNAAASSPSMEAGIGAYAASGASALASADASAKPATPPLAALTEARPASGTAGQGRQAASKENAGTEAAPEETSGAEAHESGANETYGKRQLHIYQDADGAHAWIRDADLTLPGAMTVARALSGELAASGTRLASVSLNGVRLATAEQGSRGGEGEDVYVDASADKSGAPEQAEGVAFRDAVQR